MNLVVCSGPFPVFPQWRVGHRFLGCVESNTYVLILKDGNEDGTAEWITQIVGERKRVSRKEFIVSSKHMMNSNRK
jgi:hypothetical protein